MQNDSIQNEVSALNKWATANLFPKYATAQNQSDKYFEEVREFEEAFEQWRVNPSESNLAALRGEIGDVLVTALMFAIVTNQYCMLLEPQIVRCNYIKLLNESHAAGNLAVTQIIALQQNFCLTYDIGTLGDILGDANAKLQTRNITNQTAAWIHRNGVWRFVKKANFHEYEGCEYCTEYHNNSTCV